jgi:integrase
VVHLQGKPSARDIANIFKNHVFTDVALSERDATLISTDDFVGLISKVVAAGHGRTAAKLRSYLRAAYSLAIRAKTNPAAPQSMRDFDIQINPVASIDALAQFNRALKRNLSAPELAAFLKRVRSLPIDAKRDALEVCICLGGQRPTQLLRLRRADVDLSAGVITLYDPKGRRQQPRPHLVPVPKVAADILQRRIANLAGDEPVFSTDGRSLMDCGTLTNFVTAIAVDMVKSEELREKFTLRDLRRTLETLLASWGVSSDARKHLQSHGLGGVQQRHYDQYEYLREKRAALRTLVSRLDRVLARNAAHESN